MPVTEVRSGQTASFALKKIKRSQVGYLRTYLCFSFKLAFDIHNIVGHTTYSDHPINGLVKYIFSSQECVIQLNGPLVFNHSIFGLVLEW
jgi:hypothetical protein